MIGPNDFITATDALAHLQDPAAALGRVCHYLRDGEYLFINMPTEPPPDVTQHVGFWVEQLVIDQGLREAILFGAVTMLLQKVGELVRHSPPLTRRVLIAPTSPWAVVDLGARLEAAASGRT